MAYFSYLRHSANICHVLQWPWLWVIIRILSVSGASFPLLALGMVVPGVWLSVSVCPSVTECFPTLCAPLCPTPASRMVFPPREKLPGVSRTRTQHLLRVMRLVPLPQDHRLPCNAQVPPVAQQRDACAVVGLWLITGPLCSGFHGILASHSLCRPPQTPAGERRVSFTNSCTVPAPWLCTGLLFHGELHREAVLGTGHAEGDGPGAGPVPAAQGCVPMSPREHAAGSLAAELLPG